jgi:uncharacterized membrane protein
MESLRYGFERLRQSLFLVPVAVVALCVAAAIIVRYLDREVEGVAEFPLFLSVSLSGGRSVATAVAGATITVAAIAFSITALSSQIASNQYSPRAVAGFFENRFQQVVIGLVVGTFAYALVVLAGLAGVADGGETLQRSASVTLVVVLGIGSGIAIVAYIDHSLRRMRVGAVVRRIAENTVAAVRREYRKGAATDRADGRAPHEGTPVQVRAQRMGWVRAIGVTRLARLLPPGGMARVEVRVGELVAAGDLLATVWAGAPGQAYDPGPAVRRAVYLGRVRTVDGDPGFGIRQLVDIALRALSPGINDPTTAVDVIQHLKAPLREILVSDPPGRVHFGPQRQRVFLPEAPSRSDHIHGAFAEVRLGGAGQPSVVRALIEVCADLVGDLQESDLAGRGDALVEEARLAVAAARAAGFPELDLARILSAARRLNLGDAGAG